MEYLRRKAASNPGLTYVPQFSSTLQDGGPEGWLPATGESVSAIDERWERVIVEVPAASRMFGRVKVTSP